MNFDVRFRPGKLNTIADALSRVELLPEQQDWEEAPVKEYLQRFAENRKLLRAVTRQQAKAFDPPPSHDKHNQPHISCQSTLTSNTDQYEAIFIILFASNSELIKKFINNDDSFTPSNQFQPLSETHSIAILTSIPLQQTELGTLVKTITRKVDDQRLHKIGQQGSRET